MKITRSCILAPCILALVLVLLISAPALAQAFRALYAISETGGTAYTMFPASGLVNNTYLADNGYIESDALDTRVEDLGGTAVPHMVADDRTLAAAPVPANSNVNLYYSMGNTDLPSLDIITGHDGIGTIQDTAGLEIGNDFALEWEDTYVNTDAGSDKNLISKGGVFKVYVSGDDEISAAILQGQNIVGGTYGVIGGVATEYNTLMGGVDWEVAAFIGQKKQVMPTAGTLSHLYINASAPPAAGATYTFKVFKNGAATGLTVTLDDTESADTNIIDSAHYVAGDTVCIEASFTGAPGVLRVGWSAMFHPDVYGESIFLCNSNTHAANTYYVNPQGTDAGIITESQVSAPIPTDGTFSKMYAWADGAPGAGTSFIMTLRDAGANSSLTATIENVETTGSDTANSVAVTAGDLLDVSFDPVGAPATPFITVGMVFTSTIPGEYVIMGGSPDQPNTAATEYHAVSVAWSCIWGAEAQFQISTQSTVLKDLYVKLDTAPGGATDYKLTIREDGVTTGITATITGAATTGNDLVNEYTTTPNSILTMECDPSAAAPAATRVAWGVVAYSPNIIVTATPFPSEEYDIDVDISAGNLRILIDGGVEGSVALGGASVPDNISDWILNENNVTPYVGYYKHTVSSVLKAWFQPIAIAPSESVDGTADAGGSDVLLRDAALNTYANDYWNYAMVRIVTTTDSLAPEGEYRVVTDFIKATGDLKFDALTAAIDAGDTYTVEFGTIVDRTVDAGTADSGTTTTLVDAVLVEADDYWNRITLEILTTTDNLAPEGESAIITDFAAGTDTLTFLALTATVDAGDTYELRSDTRIAWGVNPSGIAVTLGSLISTDQPSVWSSPADPTLDLMSPTNTGDWFIEPATGVGESLSLNPFHPIVEALSDASDSSLGAGDGFTEAQIWQFFAVMAILLATAAAALAVRGHMLIAGLVQMTGIAVVVSMTIFPWWALILGGILLLASLVMERSPSV